jgi:DNA polymerase
MLTDVGREAVELRLGAAKASVKKFAALVQGAGPDGRLRGQFVYYGAHTGRWSGRGVQPQNLTRTPTDQETLNALLEGKPVKSLAALATCIRPCIRAPKGFKLVVADLSAIENRVLAWLCGSEDMLDIYRNGRDPYKEFATQLFHIDYDTVTKEQRTLCKPAVLGCGYGLGPGQERELQNGTKVKTGLWAYAHSMGVQITRKEAGTMVDTFRNAYPDVRFFWDYMEDAFLAAYKTRKRQQVGEIYVSASKEAVKIELPSKRCIHYLNPHAYRGTDGLKISFDGLRMGGWGRQSTYGGRLTENVVQAVARDVLAEGMSRAEAIMPVVGHVHDELICLEKVESPWNMVRMLENCLTEPIEWAPGLPLAAEGWEGEFYMKG